MFEVNLMLLLCCAWEWIQCRRILSLRVIHLIHWICFVHYYITTVWILHYPIDYVLTPLYSPPSPLVHAWPQTSFIHHFTVINQIPTISFHHRQPSVSAALSFPSSYSTFILILHLQKTQKNTETNPTSITSNPPFYLHHHSLSSIVNHCSNVFFTTHQTLTSQSPVIQIPEYQNREESRRRVGVRVGKSSAVSIMVGRATVGLDIVAPKTWWIAREEETRGKKAIRGAWHHRRHTLVMAAAALTVVDTGAATAVSSGRSGSCLAREMKKQGKEAAQVAWFSSATSLMVTGVDGVVPRRWWKLQWRHERCGWWRRGKGLPWRD